MIWNPFNFKGTVLILPQHWMQRIWNLSRIEWSFLFLVQFGVYRFALILYNLYFHQWILNNSFFTLIILDSVQTPPSTPIQHDIQHRHKLATPLQLKLKEKFLNSNELYHHILYVTRRQPEIKSKHSKSISNTNITFKNLLFINNIWCVLHYTCTTRNHYRKKNSTLHSFNLI